jgi:hypothetical protein
MLNTLLRSLLAVALVTTAGAAAAETSKRHCSYFNSTTNESYDGPCTEIELPSAELPFKREYRFKKKVVRVTIIQVAGIWASIEINGKPGMRYEIDRATLAYSSRDLGETLDIGSPQ